MSAQSPILLSQNATSTSDRGVLASELPHSDLQVEEAFYEQCVANGAKIFKPLMATDWGTKDFYVEDPDGYIISFGGGAGG